MLEIEDVFLLYINAPADVRALVDKILEDSQLPVEPQPEHSHTEQ